MVILKFINQVDDLIEIHQNDYIGLNTCRLDLPAVSTLLKYY